MPSDSEKPLQKYHTEINEYSHQNYKMFHTEGAAVQSAMLRAQNGCKQANKHAKKKKK